MNFKIVDNNTFIVKINSSYAILNENNQTKFIKDTLIKIRKRYSTNIYGFYDVDIYKIKKILTIIIFRKKDNDNMFYNTIDLKIKNHELELNIVVDDFLLLNDYNSKKIIKGSNLKSKDVFKICEHYRVEKHNLLC